MIAQRKTCVACDSGYWVWWWEKADTTLGKLKMHICCQRCRKALDKGYRLGLWVGRGRKK